MKKVKTTMQLKIRTVLFLFQLFLFTSITLNAQEKSEKLQGIVKYNTKNLENINVINKTIKLGTASNAKGTFVITAKLGDSIEFSSLQYQNRTIVITENHLKNKAITVFLEPGFNELDEVEILQKMRLDFGNVSVQKNTQLDIDEMDLSKAPDAKNISGYNTQLTNGMDLVAIYNLLTKKGKSKKQKQNDLENRIAFIKRELPNTLKKAYGDDFFTEGLHIKNDEIYEFLDYCQDNGLGKLYDSDEIYIKDFLVRQSIAFNKVKNN